MARIVGRVVIPVPEKRVAKPVVKRPVRPGRPAAPQVNVDVPVVKDDAGGAMPRARKRASGSEERMTTVRARRESRGPKRAASGMS